MDLRVNRHSFLAGIIFLLGGLTYFIIAARPALLGESSLSNLWAGSDSLRYHLLAEQDDFSALALVTPLRLPISDYGFSNFGMFGVSATGWAVRHFFGSSYRWFVFCLNLVLLLIAINNYKAVVYTPNRRSFLYFLLLLLVNPAMYVSLTSLNKEILGVFFVSFFLRSLYFRQNIKYFSFVIVSLFFRDSYFLVGVLFFGISRLHINRGVALVVISLLLPFVVSSGKYSIMAELGAQGHFLFLMLRELDGYYFGYILSFLPKLAFQLIAGIHPVRFVETMARVTSHPYAAALALSAWAFFVSLVVLVYRQIMKNIVQQPILVDLFMAYSLIFCTLPFPTHRYFLPIYPVVVALALLPAAGRNSANTGERFARVQH